MTPRRRKFFQVAAESLGGIAALALLTWFAYRLHARPTTAALLYLALIVLASLRSTLATAIMLSVAATLCLDYYFLPPVLAFGTEEARDVVALAVFSLIALVVTRLLTALRTSETRWKNVFENNPTMYFMVDEAGTVLSVNPAGAEQLGYMQEELIGQPVLKVVVEDDKTAARHHVEHCLQHVGQSISWELRKVRKDGAVIWVRETARAVQLGRGSPVVLIACEDITAQRATQDKLRESEARLRGQASLLDLTHDAIFVRDLNDVIVYWNRGAAEQYGWPAAKAIGRVSHELTKTVFPAPLEEIMVETQKTGHWDGELVHTKRDGTRVVVASRWSLQRDTDSNPIGILETNNDITDRKRAEEELQRSEAFLRESARRYRNIFQMADVSIWEEDFSQVKMAIGKLRKSGVKDFRRYFAEHPQFVAQAVPLVRVIDVNDATLRLFGAASKEELLGSLHKIFTPETLTVFAGELLAVAEGRTSFAAEAVLQTVDGKPVDVVFTMVFPPEPTNLESVLVSIMDVTARKRAEEALRTAHDELARASTLTTMGQLAASIAHELRQPLTAIAMNASAAQRWLNRKHPDLVEARDAASRIVSEAQRADEVIRGLRALMGKSGVQREALDINEAVHQVLDLARGELRRNDVSVQADLDFALPQARGDRVQLQQVLLNLIVNAIEAMAPVIDGPKALVIRTERDETASVSVAVEDTGPGIDPATAERIFDAFFTTKPNGLGMGLSISRSIVEAHGGQISASSRSPHGTTFRFTVPTAAAVQISSLLPTEDPHAAVGAP